MSQRFRKENNRLTQTSHTQYQRPLMFGIRKFLRKTYRLIVQPRVVERSQLIVMDPSQGCANPVFIIGQHRSGTTLLRQIIDSHSHIACPPETYFIEYLAQATQHRNYFIGLEQMGFSRDEAMKALARHISAYFDAYRISKNKPRWADKTPSYLTCLPFIEELFGPGSQYVMIYRHPLDTLNSLMSKGWRLANEHDDPFINSAIYIRKGLEAQLAFQNQHPGRCFEIRYEDLTTNPEPILRRMFDFLGESWEDQVLRFNEQKHDIGVGDAEAQMLRGFSPSINNWQSWPCELIDKATVELGPVIRSLGYDWTT